MNEEEFQRQIEGLGAELVDVLKGEDARRMRMLEYLTTPAGERLFKEIVTGDIRDAMEEMGFAENTDWRPEAEGVSLSLKTLLTLLALVTNGFDGGPDPAVLELVWQTYHNALLDDAEKRIGH